MTAAALPSGPEPSPGPAPSQRRRPPWWAEARAQCGVLSRSQAMASGLSARQVDWLVRSGRWVRLYPGVFATHTGPVTSEARVWAGLLLAGAGAAAGGRTALWLYGVLDEAPPAVTVCVPGRRTPTRVRGMVITRRRRLDELRHPAATPPRLRVEEAVLDVADSAHRVEDAVDVVLRAVQRRVTTAGRLREALLRRRRHRWRGLLGLVLADVVVGVRSTLEREYLRAVERAHGLPAAAYNPSEHAVERTGDPGRRHRGAKRYRDARYDVWALVVELDGAEAHRPEDQHRDDRRDNAVAAGGRSSMRYGWRDVAGDPCGVALEVAQALTARGWGGRTRSCGPECPAGAATAWDPHSPV